MEKAKTFRIAVLVNPTTKSRVLERVTRDGRLSARARKHLGIARVKAWREVQATSWAEATAKLKAGGGKKHVGGV